MICTCQGRAEGPYGGVGSWGEGVVGKYRFEKAAREDRRVRVHFAVCQIAADEATFLSEGEFSVVPDKPLLLDIRHDGAVLIYADPFNQGDPFAGSGGKTTSIDASVGSKADKIHIRELSPPSSSYLYATDYPVLPICHVRS